jgi:hypothetical protein
MCWFCTLIPVCIHTHTHEEVPSRALAYLYVFYNAVRFCNLCSIRFHLQHNDSEFVLRVPLCIVENTAYDLHGHVQAVTCKLCVCAQAVTCKLCVCAQVVCLLFGRPTQQMRFLFVLIRTMRHVCTFEREREWEIDQYAHVAVKSCRARCYMQEEAKIWIITDKCLGTPGSEHNRQVFRHIFVLKNLEKY